MKLAHRTLFLVIACGLTAAEPLSSKSPEEMTVLPVEAVLEHQVVYQTLPPAPQYKRYTVKYA